MINPGGYHVIDEEIVKEMLIVKFGESNKKGVKKQKKVIHNAALANNEGLVRYLKKEGDVSICNKIVLKDISPK